MSSESSVPPAVKREDAVGYQSSSKRKIEEVGSPAKRSGIVRVNNGQLAFLEDGFPVYKVGYDRFLSLRLNSSIKDSTWLYYILGEWKVGPDGGWVMSEKVLRLSASQFCRLAGLIMSGNGDLVEEGTGERAMFHLGNGMYFNWGRFNRSNLATVRNFYLNASGDLMPGKQGISFGQRCYDTIKKLLMDGQIFLEIAKLKPGNPKDGLDFYKVKPAVHDLLMSQVDKQRANICVPCQAPESTEPHTCKLATTKTPPTNEEWKAAEEAVIKSKGIEAFLLCHDRVAPEQFVKLNIVEFLEKNREVLHKL
jgi:Transcriptional Coactivator p15 (PC4)